MKITNFKNFINHPLRNIVQDIPLPLPIQKEYYTIQMIKVLYLLVIRYNDPMDQPNWFMELIQFLNDQFDSSIIWMKYWSIDSNYINSKYSLLNR